jgi:15-cis-phytoene desaturase
LLSEYVNFIKLLERLGTGSRIVWHDPAHFLTLVDGQQETEMRLANLPPPMPFVPSVLADPSTSLWDKLSNFKLTAFTMAMSEDDVLRLDQASALVVLRGMGVTERYIDTFWRFVALAIMNVPLETCSAGALLRFYRRLIGHRRVSVGFADGGLGDTYAPAAAAAIEQLGGELRLGAEVRSLVRSDDGARVLGVVLDDGSELLAPHVVSTLPPQDLAQVLPEDLRARAPFDVLPSFEPCPYVSVYLWFDRKLTTKRFWARRFKAGDLNCDFYDLSNIHTGWAERPSVITSNIIFSHRTLGMTDEALVQGTLGEIADYLPLSREATVVHSRVHHIPMAIHCPYVGTEAKRLGARSGPSGLLLAGDWTDTRLPASMESAAASGYRAAECVLEDIGAPKRLLVPHRPVEGFTALFESTLRSMRAASRELDAR